MTTNTDLYEYLGNIDNDINDIYAKMDFSTEIVHMIEEVVRTTTIKEPYNYGLGIVMKWHKTGNLDLREKLRELYIYRDTITDDIQYYNLYPVENMDSITQDIDY